MMKKAMLLVAAVAMISFTSCKDEKAGDKMNDNSADQTEQPQENNQDNQSADADDSSSDEYPDIEFEDNNYDFGEIEEGDVVEHEFVFTNTGDAPLKVMQAKPTCGCTVPDWDKHDIEPGEKGSMMVKFNSQGRPGKQNKSVRLTTNTKKGNEVLRFSATVK